MKNVFWGVKSEFVRHRRHITTPLPSQLMLCKISGFRGGDYEECRLLGYENPVRMSQKTHYSSATDPSRLIHVRFQVCTAVAMKNSALRNVTSCVSCKNERFVVTYRLRYQSEIN
jgi:hypothetical protein